MYVWTIICNGNWGGQYSKFYQKVISYFCKAWTRKNFIQSSL